MGLGHLVTTRITKRSQGRRREDPEDVRFGSDNIHAKMALRYGSEGDKGLTSLLSSRPTAMRQLRSLPRKILETYMSDRSTGTSMD